MIISINGDEGSGKSTISKRVAQDLEIPRYYMGQIFRDIARKKGLTLVEYLKLGEKDPSVDREVDEHLLSLAKDSDNFLIESRTAWHLIPNSLKIYLKVSEEEGAKRVFGELQNENNRNEVREVLSLENVATKIKERRETDEKRYLKYYGIDIRNEKNYDFVLDTTNLSKDDVFDKISTFIKSKTKHD